MRNFHSLLPNESNMMPISYEYESSSRWLDASWETLGYLRKPFQESYARFQSLGSHFCLITRQFMPPNAQFTLHDANRFRIRNKERGDWKGRLLDSEVWHTCKHLSIRQLNRMKINDSIVVMYCEGNIISYSVMIFHSVDICVCP